MSSIKCENCSLINFASDSQCKRCKHGLSPLSSVVKERGYHSHAAEFQNPPPPPNFHGEETMVPPENIYCLKCGSENELKIQTFSKKYVSPVATLGIFIGILPFFLLRILLATKHEISAPFCNPCWEKFGSVTKLVKISQLGVVLSILIGIIVAVNFSSPLMFFALFLASVCFWIYASVMEKLGSPKFKKVDAKKVVIKAPNVGEVCFEK